MKNLMTRRIFAKFWATAAGVAVVPALGTDIAAHATVWSCGDVNARSLDVRSPATPDTLQSEFLLDLVLDTQPPHNIGSIAVNRIIVPVSGGTFEGPSLKGTTVGPGGEWIVARPDGSSVLDVRLVLQTDDAQKIYVTWRGISYTPQGRTQYARIVPVFETSAAKYTWLNSIVSVGVHRPMPGKVAYRVYRIL
jgi:Protein of unknown function (DUF3237)